MLLEGNEPTGSVTAEFVVTANGTVRGVNVSSDVIPSPVTMCVEDRLSHWHFGGPPNVAVTVSYGFAL